MSAQYTFTIYTFDNVLYSMDQGYNGTLINNPHILAISRDDLTTYIQIHVYELPIYVQINSKEMLYKTFFMRVG